MATHIFKTQIQKGRRELPLKNALSAKSLWPNPPKRFVFKIHLSRRPRQTSPCQKDLCSFNASNCPKSSINTLNQLTCYGLDHFPPSLSLVEFWPFLSLIKTCVFASLTVESFFQFEQEFNPYLTHVSLGMPWPFFPQNDKKSQEPWRDREMWLFNAKYQFLKFSGSGLILQRPSGKCLR
jgi:hypothetical protein